jgi:nicotinate-nucleotide pyrophosphorylase (carboxylating)
MTTGAPERTPTAVVGSTVSEATRDALVAAGLDPTGAVALARVGLSEDLQDGPDVTTAATVPPELVGTAAITPRQPGVLAGGPLAAVVFELVAGRGGSPSAITVEQLVPDGSRLTPGEPALRVTGRVADLLTAERTALNLLTHLSGVATSTRAWVDAVAGTRTRIRDSRKTLPGLRALEKYAVRCGGGVNHRMSLGDAALIKDNHVEAAGSVRTAVAAVRSVNAVTPLEVEVDTLEQLDEALAAEVDLVLLDNFTLADTREAVRRVAEVRPTTRLESSGGLTLDRAAALAQLGVDFLAVGALTHSSPALDLGLDLVPRA